MSKDFILAYYQRCKKRVIDSGYQHEIDAVEKRHFSDCTAKKFLSQFAYVVLNTGMKNQVAEKMFKRLCEEGVKTVNHKQKQLAIIFVQNKYEELFQELQQQNTDEKKIAFLETLPFIGQITKYHLARNLGIDCAKPDRHLVRLAYHFDFQGDVHAMCKFIHDKTGERIGTIDVILWRNANLFGTDIENENVEVESERVNAISK